MRTASQGLRPVIAQGLGQATTIVCSLLSTALLAHTMTTTAYGRFLAIWTFVILGAAVVRLGLARSLQREIPLSLLRRNVPEASSLTQDGWLLTAIAATLLGPGLGVVAHLLVPAIPLLSFEVLLVIAITGLEAGRVVGETAFRGLHLPSLSQVTGSPLRALTFLAITVVPAVTGAQWTLAQVLLGLLVSNLATVAVQLVATARTIGVGVHRFRLTKESARLLLASAVVFVLMDGAGVVLAQGDVLVASTALDPAATAVYGVAVRIVTVLAMVPVVVHTALAPRMASLSDNRADLHRLIRRYSIGSAAVAALGTAVFAVVGRPFIRVAFGPSYEGSFRLVLILCLGVIANSLLLLTAFTLVLQRREHLLVAVEVLCAGAEMVVGYAVAQHSGVTGLAWVSAGATTVTITVAAFVYLGGRSSRWEKADAATAARAR